MVYRLNVCETIQDTFITFFIVMHVAVRIEALIQTAIDARHLTSETFTCSGTCMS
jgi:hypothetical protein